MHCLLVILLACALIVAALRRPGTSPPGGKLRVSRDDLELLATINEPEPGENATSLTLFEQLQALLQQAVELEPPVLYEEDDEGRPY